MTSTSASGLFGRVGEFNAERETFNAYVERIEMSFTANNIVETTGEGSTQTNGVVADRKRAIFLTKVGPEVYSTLSNLLAPAKPKDTSFTDMEKHYNPKPLEIAQSFHQVWRINQRLYACPEEIGCPLQLWRILGSCFTGPVRVWIEQF